MLGSVNHLASWSTAIRLFLHVGAASIWVGGQLVMLGMLPTARSLGEGAPKALANAFAKLAWPAYAVLLITGFWNISAVGSGTNTWTAVLMIKLAVVLLAGLGAYLHGAATKRSQIALWGSVSGAASIAALALGIFLAG